MSKNDFIENVTKKLLTLGFSRNNDCWTKKLVQPSNIFINGQHFGNNIETDLSVSIFADAKINDEDAAQMLFEAKREGNLILTYEEIISYNDVDRITTLCHKIFGI